MTAQVLKLTCEEEMRIKGHRVCKVLADADNDDVVVAVAGDTVDRVSCHRLCTAAVAENIQDENTGQRLGAEQLETNQSRR
jgi:Trk K+ transport system NAD-binding subunit